MSTLISYRSPIHSYVPISHIFIYFIIIIYLLFRHHTVMMGLNILSRDFPQLGSEIRVSIALILLYIQLLIYSVTSFIFSTIVIQMPKKFSWIKILIKEINDTKNILMQIPEVAVVIKDKYPKAKFHFLVICFQDLANIYSVCI